MNNLIYKWVYRYSKVNKYSIGRESFNRMNKECVSYMVKSSDGWHWIVEGREHINIIGSGRTMQEAYTNYLVAKLENYNVRLQLAQEQFKLTQHKYLTVMRNYYKKYQ